MARIKEYYRRLEEDNRRLQERNREIEAEQAVLNVNDTLEMLGELGVETDDNS